MAWRFFERSRVARGILLWHANVRALSATAQFERRLLEAQSRGERSSAQIDLEKDAALERLRKSADAKLRKEQKVLRLRVG